MGSLFSLLWKVVATIATALGAAVVARKYTEPPPEELLVSRDETGIARGAAGGSQPTGPAGQPAGVQAPRVRLGWSKPKPEVIPSPTYWPAVLAFGLTFLLWGVISNIFVFCFGLLIMIVAIVGWAKDLLHEFSR